MKKSDYVLIVILLVINTILFINRPSMELNTASIKHKDEVLLEIDLGVNDSYKVSGDNGEVEVTVKDGKVAITKETSPLNICSKQGFVDLSKSPLICLPNKISVEGSNSSLDGVSR